MATPKDLRLLAYYVEIVQAGSIRGAAARLSLTPAVVSEALSELEASLGITLIQRTTRSMTVTDAGKALFKQAASAVAAADQAMAIGRTVAAKPNGKVSVTLPVELATAWLPPILRDFEAQNPDVHVHVEANDTITTLSTSAFDLAIRATFSSRKESRRRACACLPLELVCAPGHAKRKGETLDACLKRIGIIGSTATRSVRPALQAFPRKQKAVKDEAIVLTDVPRRFLVNNQVVAHRLALEGFGAALLIGIAVQEDLDRGALVRVDRRYSYGYVTARVLTRDSYPTVATAAFRDHLLRL